MNKEFFYIFISILLFAFIFICINSIHTQNFRTLDITGESFAYVEPDLADIYIEVESFALSATDAQKKNSDTTNLIISSLSTSEYVKEINTIGYSVYPEYNYSSTPPTLIGYRAITNLRIKSEKVNDVGILLDLILEKGATKINSISFSLSEKKLNNIKEKILSEAIKNAELKAKNIAKELKLTLGKPTHVSENYFIPYPLYKTSMSTTSNTIILPEEMKITVTVSISYEIV